jgi:hypothetical protein
MKTPVKNNVYKYTTENICIDYKMHLIVLRGGI